MRGVDADTEYFEEAVTSAGRLQNPLRMIES